MSNCVWCDEGHGKCDTHVEKAEVIRCLREAHKSNAKLNAEVERLREERDLADSLAAERKMALLSSNTDNERLREALRDLIDHTLGLPVDFVNEAEEADAEAGIARARAALAGAQGETRRALPDTISATRGDGEEDVFMRMTHVRERERAAARRVFDALSKYAAHDNQCVTTFDDGPCDCGLVRALDLDALLGDDP